MMNSSKPYGPSGGVQAPNPKRRRPRLRVPCSPSPRPSPPGTLHPLPMRVVPQRNWRLSHHPYGTFQFLTYPSLPMACKMSSLGEGETFARAVIIRRSLAVLCLRNERQKSGDCNRNVRIFQRRASALPLLGERAGVRGNEATSNPERTTIPVTVKLRESPRRAGGFPN